MSILQKTGLPYANFVEFTWRQLAKEMKISWHGKLSGQLRDAIRSIAGILITSESALIDGESRRPIQDIERGFRLIDSFVFANSTLEDGTIANRNRVVFSDWLVQNLNAKYFASYRYDVWLDLADNSTIASRMYEYLIHSFSGNHPTVSINYSRLCQFLPIKEYKTLYAAKRQLDRAFHELIRAGVLASFKWEIGSKDQFKLRLKPGQLIRPTKSTSFGDRGVVDEQISVLESHSDITPAEELVRLFYQKWCGLDRVAFNEREIDLANTTIDQFGRHESKQLLRFVLKILKTQWPDARSFLATKDYWVSAEKLRTKSIGNSGQQSRNDESEQKERIRRRELLRQQWNALSKLEQQEIIDHVYANENQIVVNSFKSRPKIREMYLLNELEHRL